MEDSGISNPQNDKTGRDYQTLSELLDFECSEYMSIGMTYEQFWHGDNDAPRMFRKMWDIKREQQDANMWHMGLYVSRAMDSAVSRFNEKKDQIEYYDKPLLEKEKELEEEKKAEQEKLAAQMWLDQLVGKYAFLSADEPNKGEE